MSEPQPGQPTKPGLVAWVAVPLCLLMALPGPACGQLVAQPDRPALRLVVTVREDSPSDRRQVQTDADGSVTVSTGRGRERESRGRESRGDDDRSTTVATADRSRRLQAVEGDRVRIDLPAIQSVRFRVPATGAGTGARARASPAAPGAASAAGSAAPVAGGVVYFESVAAFAARFAIAGQRVVIELTPLRQDTVAAYAEAPATVSVQGPIGEWIALGDADPRSGHQGADAGPAPASYRGVWVRVEIDPSPPSPR